MFLIDDVLLSPAYSLMFIFREIHNAAQQEEAAEAEHITTQLSDLYMMLDTGKISEEEFNAQEKVLLDRLDRIDERAAVIENEDGEEQGNTEANIQEK